MALAENSSGSHTATGSFVTLATITDAGYYMLAVDLTNIDHGDEVDIRISAKARTGSGYVVAFQKSYKHAVSQPLQLSPFIPTPWGIKIEIKATGVVDTYEWSVWEEA